MLNRSKSRMWLQGTLLAAFALLGGCAADGFSEAELDNANTGSRNVVQAGPQDIGAFRATLAEGQVPASNTLDPVGFFNEHSLTLPEADCGASFCVHPMLAVAPRFGGGDWTVAFLGINTDAEVERRDAHVVFAVETSVESAAFLDRELLRGVSELGGDDRVSIVSFGRSANIITEATAPASLADAMEDLDQAERTGEVNLYDGLSTAARVARRAAFDGDTKIVLITSGRSTAGITDPERIVGLGEALGSEGVSLAVVGLTSDRYLDRVPRELGELGLGAYYTALDSDDLTGVVTAEITTGLSVLARDVSVQLRVAEGYRVGEIYGASRVVAKDTTATLELPALMVGSRRSGEDEPGVAGRRGGGGGLFVELLADGTTARGNQPAFSTVTEWTSNEGDQLMNESTTVNPLAPGEEPDMNDPYFSEGPDTTKAFMMLNMYLALRSSVEFYEGGDCDSALGIIEMMTPTVDWFQGEFDDSDIQDDVVLMNQLRDNMTNNCAQPNPEPQVVDDFQGGCFIL